MSRKRISFILSDDQQPVLKIARVLSPLPSTESSSSEEDTSSSSDEEESLSLQSRKELLTVKKYILDTTIELETILSTPLRIEDKAKMIEIYAVLQNTQYPTQDYIDYKLYLQQEFLESKRRYLDYKKLSDESKLSFETEKTRLLSLSNSLPLDYQIIGLNADDSIKSCIFKEYTRMTTMSPNDDERPKLERWINTCLAMPFKRYKILPDNRGCFLRQMKESLDKNIYGLEKVKEQLLVYANARMSNPEMKDCTLGLIGPPGIGKTMIAKLISECLTIPFSQISCGGITDAETLRGHSYTYIGSRPGEIVNALTEMGYNNGVIFFDEFEKVAKNQAITSMLLHVLDPLQNSKYQDAYLGRDISVNLSGVWFVLSMNELPNDSALRDRIFTVNLKGYNSTEKFHIAKRHLVPKIMENLKIDPLSIVISDDTIKSMIRTEGEERKGMRGLNRMLKEVITKIHFLQQSSDVITSFDIKNIKNPCIVSYEMVERLIGEKDKSFDYLSMFL